MRLEFLNQSVDEQLNVCKDTPMREPLATSVRF